MVHVRPPMSVVLVAARVSGDVVAAMRSAPSRISTEVPGGNDRNAAVR